MNNDALDVFVERMRASWGPLSTELAATAQSALQDLARTPPDQPWLAALLEKGAAQTELYRDTAHGFVLLAHSEPAGLYRPPHDHGRGWVIYAVQSGEIEMGTYARIERARIEDDERVRLVRRDTTPVRAGHAKLFLPGDIHDTRCTDGPALLFRFTERDLKREDEKHRLTRYVFDGGVWTVGPRA